MIHDHVSVQEIVDSECAHEFLMEASKLASSEELEDTSYRLERKSEIFQELLNSVAVEALDEERLHTLFGLVFFLRRKAKKFIADNGVAQLRDHIGLLLNGDQAPGRRLEQFCSAVKGMNEPKMVALASELLHFSNPERYWLWSSWIWDPKTDAGALPLVLQKDINLHGDTLADTYGKVGRAMSMVNEAGHSEGFSRLGRGMFGTDIFLACVYSVYMNTVFRMKLSEEFNRILPELPEFTRRILGIHKINTESSDV